MLDHQNILSQRSLKSTLPDGMRWRRLPSNLNRSTTHRRAIMDDSNQMPVHGRRRGHANRDWWPDALDVSVLHRNSALSDPMGEAFDYAKEFKTPRPQCRDQGPACPDDGTRRNGGRPTSATTAACSSAWPGTARAPTASPTAAAAPAPASSASRRSTAGRTTPTSTRRAGCCGRSSRSTAGKSPGPT